MVFTEELTRLESRTDNRRAVVEFKRPLNVTSDYADGRIMSAACGLNVFIFDKGSDRIRLAHVEILT